MKDTRKIFLPLTLDNSTKTLFSGKQMIGFTVVILGLAAWQVLVLKIQDTLQWNTFFIVLIDLVGCWFILLFMRKVVLKENQMMRQYQEHQNLQKTDLSFIWNIFSIRDGHIYYCDGMQAVIVQLIHGYLLDRPADQERIHREAINTALGNLTKQGYKFMYLNREVKDSNLEPLLQTERQLYAYRNTPIFETASQIIRHTVNVCDHISNTEQEYYVIYADSMDTMKKLDHAAKEFISALHGGIYVQMKVLTDAEIWECIASLYGVSYINTAELLSQKFVNNQLPLVKIIDVARDDEPEPIPEEPEQQEEIPEQQVQQAQYMQQSQQYAGEDDLIDDLVDEPADTSSDDEGDFL